MFKNTILFFLFVCFSFSLLFGQSTTVKFDNIVNEYSIKKNDDSNDNISVLITDSKNPSHPKQFNFTSTESESTFVNKVISNMKDVSENYFVVDDGNHLISIVKDDELKYESFIINKPESQEALINLLKDNFALNYKTLDEFINATEIDKLNPIFKNLEEKFNLVKYEEKKVNLVFKNKEGVDVKEVLEESEEGQEFNDIVYKKLFEKFDDIKEVLKPLIVTETIFNDFKDVKLNETNRLKLSELYKALKEDKTYKFINNVILKTEEKEDAGIVYNISIKNNNEDKFYNLKFCDPTNKCSESIKILYSSEIDLFKKIVNDFVSKIDNKSYQNIDEPTLKELYRLIKANNEESIIKEATQPFNKKIDSLVLAIQNLETQYSGKLKLNKTVRVYRKREVVKGITFKVDYATVRFFNNRAKDIVLVGKLSNSDIEFTVVNVQFSVALRSFRNSINYVPISPNDKDTDLYLNYNDLFEYYPKETSSNYAVRNKEYRIEADSIVPIEERKLMDYFTAVIFSDFLGLNNQNANSLMQAEGRVKIPIWIRNFNKFSFLHSLNADINASIYNGFDDNSRFIAPESFGVKSSGIKVIDSVMINNFDYIKNNNLTAGISLDVLNYEMKGLSTDLSLGYGLRYYRAGLKYIATIDGLDVEKKYQLNALTHELSANFEIRPQLNFGADLNIALNWLHDRGAVENLDVSYNQEDGNDKKKILRLQLNLYSKLNPSESNGGVYARIGGFYHLGAKDFYPQILVGYATNLSSFVNKFSKK